MSAPLMTAEELLHTNVPNKRTELLRGRLVVHEPPGGKHGKSPPISARGSGRTRI